MSSQHGNVVIEKLYWPEVRQQAAKVNPELANIIDAIDPSNKLYFYKARYLFGQKILKNGEMQLPSKAATLSLDHAGVPKAIQNDLNYCSVPISLILSKSVEVFFETQDRVMPSKLFKAGDMFGLWEAFDPPPSEFIENVWNLSAGARTTFLLPKISDNVHHNKLRHAFGLTQSQAPRTLLDHHEIFTEIAKNADKKWWCEILFFPAHWLKDATSALLQKYWLETAWRQSFNCRANMSYDMAWETFAKDITKRNWNPKLSTINTIKHLLAIGDGIYPGFALTSPDEHAIPVRLIENAYSNDYKLKKYPAIVMQPYHLRDKINSVYYSLPLTTLLESSIKPRNSPRIIDELREIKMLMKVLLEHQPRENIKYEFFHYGEDRFSEILSSDEIPKHDPSFKKVMSAHRGKLFPSNSPFTRGCIRISKKQ